MASSIRHTPPTSALRIRASQTAAQSRTPSVAALYSVRHRGIAREVAMREVCDALFRVYTQLDRRAEATEAGQCADRSMN